MIKIYIRLIHWNQAEAKELALLLNKEKYEINTTPFSPGELKGTVPQYPDIFIIDLSRLPSQGRDLGIFLRKNKSTRNIPIIYTNGEQEKLSKLKNILPDANYASWDDIDKIIDLSLNKIMDNPVIPDSVFAGYEGVSLIKKLGIKNNMKLAVIDSPDNFHQIIGKLPDGINVQKKMNNPDLIIWFVSSVKQLEKKLIQIKQNTGNGGLWIVYPKKSSQTDSDLSQTIVRNAGLAAGLVDYKVCSIDNTWTGLKFAVRKK